MTGPPRSLPLFRSTPASRSNGARAGVGGPPYVLRVSLLEHCTYRCPYCRPGQLRPFTRGSDWLSVNEHARMASLLARHGVRKVRFTGGEPLLRADFAELVSVWRRALPSADLSMTTNAQRFTPEVQETLQRAGLERVTIHLDTLRADRYPTLMGGGTCPEEVLARALLARERFREVKLNVVVQRGRNDDELEDFLAWSRETGVEARFIEMMNTGSASGYVAESFLSGADVVEKLRVSVGAQRIPRRHQADPAALYQTGEGVVFGVIASDTEPFCDHCDRLRLSADGRLRTCLYQGEGAPLGAAMRAGADDVALADHLRVALVEKRPHHPLLAPAQVPFSMAELGG